MLNKGDLIWVARYDTQGHELTGRHPAVVISPTAYNKVTKMAVVCSITSVARGNLFEVQIPEGCGITGVVKVDALTTIDWGARAYDFAGRLPKAQIEELSDKLVTFLS